MYDPYAQDYKDINIIQRIREAEASNILEDFNNEAGIRKS